MIRRPFAAVDYEELVRAYPPPPEYFETVWFASPDQIEAMQLARLRQRAVAAARVPFFERRWAAVDFDPQSIRALDDLWKAPVYTVEDIRKSIDAHPP